MPLRVLQIGPYSTPHGGVQAHVVALRQYLLAHGAACEVIDMNRDRRTDGAGVYGPRGAAGVARLLLTLRYDIVHLHVGGNLTARLAGLALFCTSLPRRKSVFTFHSGGYPSSPAGRAARPAGLRGLAMRRFDRVVAVNEEIGAWFRQVGVPEGRVRVIRPYALPAAPPAAEPPDWLRSFLARHKPVLVSVGMLEPEYDLPLQIEALGRVREQFPGAGLVLVGSGSLEGELRRQIAAAPYGEHVLLCGDVDRAVTLRVIAGSDLMLRTTLYDGDSISVREAVHFGVPVVATDRAPRPEGVRLVPARDLARLSEAAAQCLRNGGRRPPLGRAREENLEAVHALYEELAGES
ncbi:MAG TPA: glycosyltransferase family 4 protein [Pyrinomonadaceae bacterium]|nr:glycosyltransferase family 4 protein [Pyrinomonadaceae bacterium]